MMSEYEYLNSLTGREILALCRKLGVVYNNVTDVKVKLMRMPPDVVLEDA